MAKSDSQKRADRRRRRAERKQADRREQAERRRQEAAERWEGWEDVADNYREEVRDAMSGRVLLTSIPPSEDQQAAVSEDAIDLRWRRDPNKEGKTKGWQALELDDIALYLFAVDRYGGEGLSYQQTKACFRRWGRSCHDAKVAAMRQVIESLGIVVRSGRYSVGHHGDQFKRPKPTKEDQDKDNDAWIKSLGNPKDA